MSFIEVLPGTIFALCIVWKGESWYVRLFFYFFFSSLHLVLIKCCESVYILQSSTAQDCTIDPFYPIWTATHVLHLDFVSSVTVIFEQQVLLCVALMNHYFCTCFVHLIKKNMLCSSNAVWCLFIFFFFLVLLMYVGEQHAAGSV